MPRQMRESAKRITERRLSVMLTGALLVLAILLVNIVRLDIFGYQKYSEKAFDQLTTTSTLKAERGRIYDANMKLLSATGTTWRIYVSPKVIREYEKESARRVKERLAEGLAEIFDKDKDTLLGRISDTRVLDVTVEASASEEEYRRLLDFLLENDLEGLVGTEAQSRRYYPEGTLAAHVLGFTGSDGTGLYGLEYYYNSTLSGTDGSYLYAKDANGLPMPNSYTAITQPTDGNSLVTTIDSYIQEVLEAELSEIVVNHSVTGRACGIVMDTRSGAILAMATSSPFDPNSPFTLDSLSEERLKASGFAEGSEEYKKLRAELMQLMWSNKAVSETYEPGSTFKIVTVAAALDSGAAEMTDRFSCTGSHTIGGWRIRCHKTTGHGSGFTLAYGLQMSCNPTMMAIAERTGKDSFYNYVERFGYFEKTGIDLPSEARTIFHELESIGPTELATASFGQRFKVTVISQLRAIAAIANGGYLVEPYIVDKIIDKNGNVIKAHEPSEGRRVVSAEVAKEIARVLEEGVSGDGGAKNAYVEGYSVAAKTGTSQKFDILDANGSSYLRIGSTVAFAPSDESGVALIIVVDEPQSSVKYGSTVAAPYVSDVLEKILPYLEYESSAPPSTFTTENYVGMNVNSAKSLLSSSEINYEIIGDGKVVLSQAPEAGVDITKGLSTVYLYTVSRTEGSVTVPSVVGMELGEANKTLAALGFNINLTGVKDLTSGILTVVSQSLPPGVIVKQGSCIELRALCTSFED